MRSQKAFMQALIQLMYTTPIEKITITEICKHAKYSRNAFYNLFASKEALIDYTVSCITNDLQQQLTPTKEKPLSDKITESVTLLQKNHALFKLCLKDNKIKGFRESVFNVFYQNLLAGNLLNEKGVAGSPIEKHMAAVYYTASASSLLFTWLQDDMPMPPEHMLNTIIAIKHPQNHAILLGAKPFKYIKSYQVSTFKDVRVLRTEQAFYEAFMTILAEKNYEGIKIKEIIALSGYNKSTFYKYYSCLDDLFSASMNRFVKDIFLSMSLVALNNNNDVLVRLFQIFYEHRHAVHSIHISGLFHVFYQTFYQHLAREYYEKECHADYITSSIFCIVGLWLNTYPQLSPVEVATIYQKLLQHDIYINIDLKAVSHV